jgi:2-dehydro-3-deoxyphosphogluconate aldolase / (4S)-4-hydroxy-2-oxoglutarate aldolase
VKKEEIVSRIEEIGIIPAVRLSSPEEAYFAAAAVNHGGISIAEITVTVPGAVGVIARLVREFPGMIVGAGTVLDIETARLCLDAGAHFLTSPGLALDVVEFAVREGVAVFPGALTPTEVITAWKAGADLVKVFPCAAVGGERYLRALKAPLPQVQLIASGGVTQQTASNFIAAGAVALGIGGELIPHESVQLRREDRIRELARRFTKMVKEARKRTSTE